MKKIVTVIGDMILYFVIVSVIGMVMKKFGWLEGVSQSLCKPSN